MRQRTSGRRTPPGPSAPGPAVPVGPRAPWRACRPWRCCRAARAVSICPRSLSTAAWSWPVRPAARARASGFVRRHSFSSDSCSARSTACIRPSTRGRASRGTCPMASQRSLRARKAARAALRSVTGTSFSASVASSSLSFRFSDCSASRSAKTSLRAAKKTSCAPRKRFHSSSSASRWARPAAFHSVIRSR